jgi:hypothetical protein
MRHSGSSYSCRSTRAAALATALVAAASAAPLALPLAAQARVTDISALMPVAAVPVRWTAGSRPHTVELRNASPGSAPRLAVLSPAGRQVAGAEPDGATTHAQVIASESGAYTVVVRAGSAGTATGDLWIDGRLTTTAVRFSPGTAVPYQLADREDLIALAPPRGAATHQLFVLDASGGAIVGHVAGARTRLPRGAPRSGVALYGARDSAAGPLRVLRNDAGTDTDGDGLGNALEAALGTCAAASGSVAGVECRDLADPRDTDGDGLWDGWEVLGYDATWIVEGTRLVRQYLPLPAWGADPRHKDVFAEVDFRRLTKADNEAGLAEHMSPADARAMAAIFADAATTSGPLRLLHAVSVDNPDRRPGIALHLDTGVPPESAADATIYGGWGGYSALDAIMDPDTTFRPRTPAEGYELAMSPGRRGIFHYVLGYTSGGGSCGMGIACGFNFRAPASAAHEFGHTFGLDHNGPGGVHEPNCKPNYPSLMNYAYLDRGWMQFADGRGLGVLNNHALVETGAVLPNGRPLLPLLRDWWGYRVDSASGSVDWNRDGRFAPADAPVRAYGNLIPNNSGGCEFTREGETPAGLESERSPAIVRYADHLWVFAARLDGHLGYTYTAPPFTCPVVDGCPAPGFVPAAVREIGPIDGLDAAVITVSGRRLILIVGIRPDGSLFETWVEQSSGLWVWGATLPIPGSLAAGEPSLAATSDGRSVVLAYRGRDGVVRERTRGPATWGPERIVTVGGRPLRMSDQASPSVAFTGLPGAEGPLGGGERLVGAFVDTSGVLRLYAPDRLRRGWTGLEIPYPYMATVVGRPSLAWAGPVQGAVLATAGAAVEARGAREAIPTPGSPIVPAAAAAIGAAAGATAGSPSTVGRLYLAYIRHADPVAGDPKPDPVRMVMSYVDGTGRFRLGLDSFFDNVWSFAFGIDLLQPGETALRAAQTYSLRSAFRQVTLRPHADGVADLPYRNYDDWPVLAWGSCAVLAGQQRAPRQTACTPRPW